MDGGIRCQAQRQDGIDLNGTLTGKHPAQAVRHGSGQDIGAGLGELHAAAPIVQAALHSLREGNGLAVHSQGPFHPVLAQVGRGHFYLHRLIRVGKLRELERQPHGVPHADGVACTERAAQLVRHAGGHSIAAGRGKRDLAALVGQVGVDGCPTFGSDFPRHIQVSSGQRNGGGLVNVGCLRAVQYQVNHRVNLDGQCGGELLSQRIRDRGGENIVSGTIKGELSAVILQRNGNTLAVSGHSPLDSRGCSVLHGQADCQAFILVDFSGVSRQGKGQVWEHMDRHRLGRKLPALSVRGDGGERVVSSAVKGQGAAVLAESGSGLFAVMGQSPADISRVAALHGHADFCRFVLMHLVRTGGHSGGKDRQDRNGAAGGVLLAGGVREGGRQGIAARLG